MDFEDNHDHTVPAPLTEEVLVSWSKPRCWHGDTVTIRVRTGRVIDGSTVELKVWVQGAGAHFHQIPNQPINHNQLDFDYTLNWKTFVIPAGSVDFVVTARIVQINITSAPSEPMKVDLIEPLFSA